MEPNPQLNINISLALSPIGFQMLCEEQRHSLQLEPFEDDFLHFFSQQEDLSQAEILQIIEAQHVNHNDETEDESSEMQELSVINTAIGNTFDDGSDCSSSHPSQKSEDVEDEEFVNDDYEYFDDDMYVE